MRALGFLWFGLRLSVSSHAAGLFKACDTVQTDRSVRALSLYFVDHPGAHLECLALDRGAFVFTTEGNFLDCRTSKGAAGLECNPPSPSSWYRNLELLASFSGDGMTFALFHSSQLKGGVFGESYEVFYLVPRQVDAHGYRIVTLEGAGAHDQSDGSGACPDAVDLQDGQAVDDVVRAGKPPFEILHAGRNDVTIRISQQTVCCPTGEAVDSTGSYRWSGDRFIRAASK